MHPMHLPIWISAKGIWTINCRLQCKELQAETKKDPVIIFKLSFQAHIRVKNYTKLAMTESKRNENETHLLWLHLAELKTVCVMETEYRIYIFALYCC